MRAALARPIVVAFGLFAAYVAATTWLLAKFGLWTPSQLKTTLLWSVFAAPGMVGRMVSHEGPPRLLQGWLKDTLRITVILDLLVETYTFPFWVEFLLVPVLVTVGGMIAVGGSDERYKPAVNLLNGILIAWALFLFGRATWLAATHWSTFATLSTLRDLYTVPMLALSLLPFLYFAFLYSRYSEAFVLLPFRIPEKGLRDYAQAMAIAMFNVRTGLLPMWRRRVDAIRPTSRREVVETINATFRIDARQKNPPPIDAKVGWCPVLAGTFLAQDALTTGEYHHADGDHWFASARMKPVSEGLWQHYLNYYIDGDAVAAHALRLKLYINGPDNRESARNAFRDVGQRLIAQAFTAEDTTLVVGVFDALEPFNTNVLGTDILLARQDFPNQSIPGYELTLELRRRA